MRPGALDPRRGARRRDRLPYADLDAPTARWWLFGPGVRAHQAGNKRAQHRLTERARCLVPHRPQRLRQGCGLVKASNTSAMARARARLLADLGRYDQEPAIVD